MHWLTVVGMLVEGIGLVVTVSGLVQTFRDFAEPGASLRDPIEAWLRSLIVAARRLAGAGLARVLRRRRDVVVNVGIGTIQFGASMNARARVTWGPLPDGTTTSRIEELDRRVQAMSTQMADLADRLGDDLVAIRETASEITQTLTQEVERLESQTRELAVGGIRLQIVGVGFVAVGLILQIGGALAGA